MLWVATFLGQYNMFGRLQRNEMKAIALPILGNQQLLSPPGLPAFRSGQWKKWANNKGAQ